MTAEEPELKREVYKVVFETWRHQVNSYWQRNSYFAAFETVAIAGGWYVVEHCHLIPGLVFAVLGALSRVAWLITSRAVHCYIDHWWESIKHIEHVLSLDRYALNFATRHPGSRLHWSASRWVHVIPVLFMCAWLLIAGLAICYLLSCRPCIVEPMK